MMAASMPLRVRGVLRLNEPMARHTSWRVGGPADRFYQPADIEDLADFLAQTPADEPLFWLGLGSNLLVRDGGLRGTVICTSGMLNGMSRLPGEQVRAEAGLACPKVARWCARQGLCGLEFLAGIPGTLGGALAMNAGAFGGETWERVVAVETLDRRGGRHVRPRAEFSVGYRMVKGPADEWFVAGILQLEPGEAEAAAARIKTLLAQRGASQPTQQANAGSVFRNPAGDHAGRLIEAAGLKGLREGGACVSDKHANFIINTGSATARDIETLIGRVAARVQQASGVVLVPEVRIVGEAAGSNHDER